MVEPLPYPDPLFTNTPKPKADADLEPADSTKATDVDLPAMGEPADSTKATDVDLPAMGEDAADTQVGVPAFAEDAAEKRAKHEADRKAKAGHLQGHWKGVDKEGNAVRSRKQGSYHFDPSGHPDFNGSDEALGGTGKGLVKVTKTDDGREIRQGYVVTGWGYDSATGVPKYQVTHIDKDSGNPVTEGIAVDKLHADVSAGLYKPSSVDWHHHGGNPADELKQYEKPAEEAAPADKKETASAK